jgi:putative oxidoreductase
MMTDHAVSRGVPAAGLMVPFTGAVIILRGLMVSVGVWPDLGAWRETDPVSKVNGQPSSLKELSLAGAALALFAFFASAGGEFGLVLGPVLTL